MKKVLFLAGAIALMQSLSAAPMLTPWGEKVTSENAWRSYPRP